MVPKGLSTIDAQTAQHELLGECPISCARPSRVVRHSLVLDPRLDFEETFDIAREVWCVATC